MERNFTKIIIKKNIRIYLSDFTDVVNNILNYHKYSPFPSLIMANAICSFTPLKYLYNSNNLMIRIKSNGPIKSIIFEAKNNNVRSLISDPNIVTEYDKTNYNLIPLILGIGDDGIFEVSREINNEIFKSETKLAKFDIVTDVAYFLNKSDQIFSVVINDVELSEKDHNKTLKAKNIIFQLLPNHTEEDKKWIEDFISKNKLKNNSIQDIEKKIDGDILETKNINANCWCNKDKIIDAINLLTSQERKELFKDDEYVEAKCEFCLTNWKVYKEEVSS
ncbi:MAG: Hsp33 family molecular chaperone HslO [Mycoplasma sp.]|nr:Hsp33 family molecular chaperone HslO [Mycoplasma sp.]